MLRLFAIALVTFLTIASGAFAEQIARIGVITDIHHTNRPDSSTRFYSAALPKTQHFVDTMAAQDAGAVVELGDFVDLLVNNKDPLVNLGEVESIFTSFAGPHFHTLGNHEFDNVTRAQLLANITNTGIPAGQTYYSFDVDGIHCVVLDADYTVAEPHIPFDMMQPGENWWTWMDAWIPQAELDWLAADLAATDLPAIVFSHQLLSRALDEPHTIKNADAVRAILEMSGNVLASFAGHDHLGGYHEINGIHYVVLEGNVSEGVDPVAQNQFALVEVNRLRNGQTFQILVNGYGQQGSYDLLVENVVPVENPYEPNQPAPAATMVLDPNYPNPFNPQTTISFSLAQAGHVNLSVFDLQGHLVRTLVDESRAEGRQSVVWDGAADDGRRAASGTYVYRLTTESTVISRSMVLAK